MTVEQGVVEWFFWYTQQDMETRYEQSALAYVQRVSALVSQSVLILTNMRPYRACLDAFVHLKTSQQTKQILIKPMSFQVFGLRILLLEFWQMQIQLQMHSVPKQALLLHHVICMIALMNHDNTRQQGTRCQLFS